MLSRSCRREQEGTFFFTAARMQQPSSALSPVPFTPHMRRLVRAPSTSAGASQAQLPARQAPLLILTAPAHFEQLP